MKDIIELLLIKINNKTIGIDLKEIREIHPYVKYFPVPNIPKSYLGLINIRGEIWVLLDIKKILFKQETEIEPQKNKILITKYYEQKAAFIIDEVEDILELTIGEINKIKKDDDGKECFSGEVYYKKRIIPIIKLKEFVFKNIKELEEIDFNHFI